MQYCRSRRDDISAVDVFQNSRSDKRAAKHETYSIKLRFRLGTQPMTGPERVVERRDASRIGCLQVDRAKLVAASRILISTLATLVAFFCLDCHAHFAIS